MRPEFPDDNCLLKKVSDVNNALSTYRFAIHYSGMFSHEPTYNDFVEMLLLHKQ